ncbi:hypothetical protein KFK09_026304 [Dendrobium nobile]|uniref:RING-type E3 ubiquitin transferase n=1 Tax=Dendrobium nobile TaxID=94219 RepID=A0A8T3A7K4_DENNO|nr:hypothetical protein KFK09_026304 [Dendrobium nobile]
MSSYSPQNSNQGQQWPFTDNNTKSGSHMELVAALAVILIFILISFHLYVRYRRRSHVVITIHRGRRRTPPINATETGGLDATAMAALPTFINRAGLSANECREECAVCLSVAEEGQMMRLLPDCKHVFHIECIDTWLHSHSTCPVCRTKAKPTTKSELGELLAEPPLPERFGRGGGGGALEEGSSESSELSRTGNGSTRWVSTVDGGVVDLERQ